MNFERNAESNEAELSFTKEDVLYVDNTMFRGVSGQWRAWKLDEYGCRVQCGIIPSQMKYVINDEDYIHIFRNY